ncbi:c-type cytochrome domain-containing protein [Salmonirosea aquatica]|uniref:Cytochrome C n=1 Tax=Salmonirosea aquatica TaxID=2654236 RepID=A0A7C9G041_9BACT|nr:cytochrome C [Cytophagaceae bacterium SJW1-29]
MKIRIVAENILLGLTITIAFLLLFESKLVVPVWLQSFGRMHPLLLHFPIVLLLLAMLMEFFRFKPENLENTFYHTFSQNLLLSGALLAAVTVLMGLFLSREEGYAGDTLFWHKWTGAGIFFLATLLYFVRNARWYKAPVAWAGGGTLLIALVLAGHYGASLTHGDNFLFEPWEGTFEKAEVPLEQAVVFTDVIQPIFEQKCVSCHNADKLKGQLMLTNAESVRKGGKTGKLFVPGNPEISLLLQRVHLPQDAKKHMPPSGKTQLSPEEISLLTLWVRDHPSFDQKVTDLPLTDSLRILSAARLKSSPAEKEQFDFSAADEETVKKLNTDYRTVAPLARESPGLAVTIYNKNAYTSAQLEELKEVIKQIVSLNLNKMPVQDADLKTVGTFENLRKLDLNFTNITAQGLKELASLKYLKTLTLSGTPLNVRDLRTQLSAFKALETVTVWETGLTPAEIAQLQKAFPRLTIIGGFVDDGKNPLKLNPPQVANSTTVFAGSVPLQLRHPIKGVEIRFTTDGTEPDSINSPVFNAKTVLTESATIKAQAFKKGWFGSEVATFDFFKNTYQPDSVELLFPLNRVHLAEGAKTFFNQKLGVIGANNPAWANYWAGVRNNDLGMMAEFKQPTAISSVGLHYMVEEDTGIFPPQEVEVWGGPDRNSMKLLTRIKAPMPAQGDTPTLKSIAGTFDQVSVRYLKIVAKPVTKIPDWHRSKGNKALLLVDEMFIN